MSLFQRQPDNYTIPVTYSFGAQSTRLIVGLGNPGKEYDFTRHNVGFLAVDMFAEANEFPAWQENKKFKGFVTEKLVGQHKVILLKPNTFMNESGQAVQALLKFYRITMADMVVVHDELAIDFGQVRTRIDGQDAGNNGVKSVIAHIGSEFGRIRVGIKNPIAEKAEKANFVLGKFTKEEQKHLPAVCNEVSVVITEWLYGGSLPHDTRSVLLD